MTQTCERPPLSIPEQETKSPLFPVSHETIFSGGHILTGNFVPADTKRDAVVIIHGAAPTEDPLIGLALPQQLMAQEGVSSFALRLRGIGDGDQRSQGERHYSLNDRIPDAVAALELVKAKTGAKRLHLMGLSMNAHVVAGAAAELGRNVTSLTLVEPAAYPKGAEDIPIIKDGLFSRLIREPDKDLSASPTFALVEKYVGPMQLIHGSEDRVVNEVFDLYAMRANSIDIVPGVAHTFVKDSDHPLVQNAYRKMARMMQVLS